MTVVPASLRGTDAEDAAALEPGVRWSPKMVKMAPGESARGVIVAAFPMVTPAESEAMRGAAAGLGEAGASIWRVIQRSAFLSSCWNRGSRQVASKCPSAV